MENKTNCKKCGSKLFIFKKSIQKGYTEFNGSRTYDKENKATKAYCEKCNVEVLIN